LCIVDCLVEYHTAEAAKTAADAAAVREKGVLRVAFAVLRDL
jgi:hypothetical protein